MRTTFCGTDSPVLSTVDNIGMLSCSDGCQPNSPVGLSLSQNFFFAFPSFVRDTVLYCGGFLHFLGSLMSLHSVTYLFDIFA